MWREVVSWIGSFLFQALPFSTSRTYHMEDGSINEKKMIGNEKNLDLSLMLHSTFGLDHYPNYLLRWDKVSIEMLESKLSDQLKLVQRQKKALQVRTMLSEKFEPILSKRSKSEIFDVRFLAVFSGQGPSPSRLSALIDDNGDGAISFPLFTEGFCNVLIDHAERFVAFSQAHGLLDQSGGERPMVLSLMKLDWLNDLLLESVINPIAQLAFSDEVNRGSLDWRHGYIVSYHAKPETLTNGMDKVTRSRLVAHTDDSELTLNICLGRDFQGGEVLFSGLRGDLPRPTSTEYQPRSGRALMHAGRQLHAVAPVTGGSRFALIVWARALQAVRARACPCCWINRRDPARGGCICGPAWN